MESKRNGEPTETEQSMKNPPQSAPEKAIARFRSVGAKRSVQIIAGVATVVIILSIAVVSLGGIGTKKPQGTYVCYLSGVKIASYEFKGNNVEYFMLGNTNQGTFQMEDNTVFIEYEDGGTDQFTYDAEKDELDMAGVFVLTKEK